jgi:hypothetical protein
MGPEKKIETFLAKEVLRRKGFTRKLVSPGHKGFPDRVVFVYGQTIFVEVKAEQGTLSKLQAKEIMRIKQHGRATVVYSKNDVKILLEALRTNASSGI